ncbi:MAG: peptidyl-tRNA hydrolase [Pseudomonadota bacterium]
MAGTSLKLIVGLGNPGEKYARTRHNAGFWFADEIARRYGGVFRAESRHQGELARVRITLEGGAQSEVWLLKPMTFMNKSGGSIASLANFYRVSPEEVLVAHDELDLPFGVARLKLGGGHGGHNGLRDTIATFGAEFWRMRLGIGHPGHKDLVHDYVLQRAPSDQERAIDNAVNNAVDVLPVLLSQGAEKAMNRLHTQD